MFIHNSLQMPERTEVFVQVIRSRLAAVQPVQEATGTLNFLWQPGTGLNDAASANPELTLTSLTSDMIDYIVTITDQTNCVQTDTVVIIVHPKPVADAGVDQATFSGSPVTLSDNSAATLGTPPYVYEWFPTNSLNDSTIAHPLATPQDMTTYILKVTDANGCMDTDTVIINVQAFLFFTERKIDFDHHDLARGDIGSNRDV